MSDVVTCPACGKKNRVPPAASGVPHCGACRSPLPWLVPADDGDFAAVVTGSPLPVLVDLWAPWCGPCHALAPAVEEVARALAGRLKVAKVNVDEAPATSGRFGVQSIPTLVVLEGGQVVGRQVGAVPAPALRRWVEETLARVA